MKRLSLKHVALISVAAIVILTATALVVLKNNELKAVKQSSAKETQSEFSFAGAKGWRQGPSNQTSMALFSDSHECFTSIEHKPGAVNVAAELQKQQADVKSGGNKITAAGTSKLTVQTSEGLRNYELHEFSLSSGDTSNPLMGGLGLGYVPVAGGYLYIQSHCNTPSELTGTFPALKAYSFNTPK